MLGITSTASRTIWSRHPRSEREQIHSCPNVRERVGAYAEWWMRRSPRLMRIAAWSPDLGVGFKAAHQASREDGLTSRPMGFLRRGRCAVSQHVQWHKAVCSTPTRRNATRCCCTLCSVAPLSGQILNLWFSGCGLGSNLSRNFVGVREQKLILSGTSFCSGK